MRRVFGRIGRRLARLDVSAVGPVSSDEPGDLNERYVESAPSAGNAVDLFAGQWSTRLPIEAPTGPIDLIGDHRVVSCVEALGGITDAKVLELGPLEGAHSITLRQLGARRVVAIEANTNAYLRCLITKEVTGLHGVEFRLGDFRPYLASTDEHFDLAVAIGVLYHLDDPVPVLVDLTRITDRIVIWTHVYNREFDVERLAHRFDSPVERLLDATTYHLHPYRYAESLDWNGFCGGTRPSACWIERDDLLDVVESLGFDVVLRDDHDHQYGPAITLAIQRR